MNKPQPLKATNVRKILAVSSRFLPRKTRKTRNNSHNTLFLCELCLATVALAKVGASVRNVERSMFDVGCLILDAQGGRAVSALAQRRDAVATLHIPAFRAFRVFRGQKNDVSHQEAFA